ncbi:MAG: DegT/DnrJ/EryC1/StrS aminotransferase family protein [Alphaproteobacteria bacterium]|nr:MAG: DegT/DnrJ/EryC1/StrS aminotransferase family protein [Alphaproteobacteria bacterium]
MTNSVDLIARSGVEDGPINFMDLKAQQNVIRAEVDAVIQKVLDHGRYISGPEIDELEAELARRTGAVEVVGCASGTDALIIPLMGEGIGPGDAVFIPGFTYNATANAVLAVGATPVFVDIDPKTFNICTDHLEAQIDATLAGGKLTPKAIIAVDLFGLPADYPTLTKIADKHGLFFMADAAQSFGGAIGDNPVGSLAPVSGTSFFPSKTLGCYGDGGAIFSMDKERADIWKSIRFHGTDDARKESLRVGINGRLDTIQAAILLVKLKIFDAEWENRNRAAQIYYERLSERLGLPPQVDGFKSSWGLFSGLARSGDDRARIQSHLQSKKIPSAIYYTMGLHVHHAFSAYAPDGGLPHCEDASTRILALPMHPYLTDENVHDICDAVLEVN